MAPGDVCHGPRCSLAGLRPVALGYRPCCWPGGSAWSPQCVRPMGCWFFPVPRPPYMCTCVRCPGPLGSCSPVCPLGALFRLCGLLGHLAPVYRCARVVCCVACVVSWATWLLFTGVPARCVALCCGVLGHLALVHRCARSVRCFACAVSWATWLLFTDVASRCVALRVRCPRPLGSCSRVCPLGALLCLCGVLGHLAPVHRCARSSCCFACAVSWATWLLFTGVPARCVALRVRCLGPLGSCSPLCPRCLLCCVCGVLGDLDPVQRCARLVRCSSCAVSWATWLLFSGVPARCVVLRVRYPRPLGSCSKVRPLGALLCLCGVLGHLAPVHPCARWLRCFACAVSWATWLLFTGEPAPCVALRVRCLRPLGSCSPVCPLGVLYCVCGVLGHLAPVHLCPRSVCCVACAVFWAPWLPFTGVPARCAVLRARCPGPLGSCSPVRSLGLFCCVYGVLGSLALVQRCASSVCCVACAVSWPLGSCSPVCPLGVLCCAYGVPAPWLLFTGVLARCGAPCVACAGERCGAHTWPSRRRLFVAGRG